MGVMDDRELPQDVERRTDPVWQAGREVKIGLVVDSDDDERPCCADQVLHR